MNKEVWKDVFGYEGLYQVSNLGRIRSMSGLKREKGHVLHQSADRYFRVNLHKNGKSISKNVHRLVAEAFIPNPNKYPCVNHKDENTKNNNVENLEWCTQKYNINYGNCLKKKTQNHIIQKDLNNNVIKIFKSAIEVEKQLGYSGHTIRQACRKKEKYFGYIWEYLKVERSELTN